MTSNNNNKSDYECIVDEIDYKIKDMKPRYQTRYQDSLAKEKKEKTTDNKIILLRKKTKGRLLNEVGPKDRPFQTVSDVDISNNDQREVSFVEFNKKMIKLFNDVLNYRTIYYENLFNYNLYKGGMTDDEKEEIYEAEYTKLANLTNEEKDIVSFNYFKGKKNKIRKIFEYISNNIEYLDDNLKSECSKKILEWKSGKCRCEKEIANEYFYLLKKLE
jgi:hypothetical protein